MPGRRHYEDEWRTVYVLNRYPSDEHVDIEQKQRRLYANNVIVTSKVRCFHFLSFIDSLVLINYYFLVTRIRILWSMSVLVNKINFEFISIHCLKVSMGYGCSQ